MKILSRLIIYEITFYDLEFMKIFSRFLWLTIYIKQFMNLLFTILRITIYENNLQLTIYENNLQLTIYENNLQLTFMKILYTIFTTYNLWK